ncbi:MAG: hypothetical protein GY820_37815 [Gammaproteobacteria bacterium]|nr:hypothetical protein [Gammaproteobacteria bacterium]
MNPAYYKEETLNAEGKIVYHSQDRGRQRESKSKLLPTPCAEMLEAQHGFTKYCLDKAAEEAQLLNREMYSEVRLN